MLYYLFDYLDSMNFPGAGLFQFISFRAAMALITSLIVSIFFGKKIINLLRRQQIGETVRDLGLAGQVEKSGTPTMGGVIILFSIILPVLLWADFALEQAYVLLQLVKLMPWYLLAEFLLVFLHSQKDIPYGKVFLKQDFKAFHV